MNDTITDSVVMTPQVQPDLKTLPSTIEIFRAGNWETPFHGKFEITLDDIDQTVANFNAGKYRVQGTEPLPGTIDHLGGDTPAAFRIHGLYRVEDSLMANVTWTELGKEKLARDEYRYISAEFNPRAFPLPNPENAGEVLVNVLTAATLTNDPLFKKLKPVLASARAGASDNSKGEKTMDLATIRAKKPEDLSEDEKNFLDEHKAELTDDERKAFGFQVGDKPAEKPEDKPAEEEPKPEKVEASAGVKGTVTITQAELDQLKAGAAAGVAAKSELLKTQLTASVKTHVERGAIKSDQLDEAVEILLASAPASRERIEKFLTALPTNAVVTAGVKGSSADAPAIEVSEEERALAAAFGNSVEDIEKYKKAEAEKEGK